MFKSKEEKYKWEKENTLVVPIHLMKSTDADVVDWLGRQPSKQGAIKKAIREKMQREQLGGQA